MSFFLEVLIGGLLSGVMYSLVAIGFVLVYKSSGVFNFAQGSMLLFAALTVAGLMERGASLWSALAIAAIVMILLGVMIERWIMRPLVNQSLMSLFMATVGLSILLAGLAQAIWGTQVHGLHLGISDAPIFLSKYLGPNFDILVSTFDLVAAGIAGAMVIVLALLFQKTKTGLFLRAVSEDHLAAQAVGIPLARIWAIVWAATGIISLIAGVLWGARTGVSFSLTEVVLKGLPAILIGGFGSIPGAILGGLIVGLSENLGEIYVAPLIGGQGIGNWFVYVVALVFLMINPSGLFGDRQIQRV